MLDGAVGTPLVLAMAACHSDKAAYNPKLAGRPTGGYLSASVAILAEAFEEIEGPRGGV